MDIFGDWKDRGSSVVGALLAEAFVAELCHVRDPETRWAGGQQRGYDIKNADGRRDVKRVQLHSDGHIVLARRNAEPFDPGRVDFLTLIHLTATTGFGVDLVVGTAGLSASAHLIEAWDIPVEDMNRMLPVHGSTDPVWRNVVFDPADLADYKIDLSRGLSNRNAQDG